MKASFQWLWCDTVHHVVKGGSYFYVWEWNPMCDNSNESHLRALSCGGVFRAMQSGSKFSVCVRELVCMNLGFKRKLKSHFHTVLTFKLSMKAYRMFIQLSATGFNS